MFLKVHGVTGESGDADHKGEIDVVSWSWEMESPMEAMTGVAKGRAVVGELKIVKKVGEAEQYFYSSDDSEHFRSHASFYLGEFGESLTEKGEGKVSWIPLAKIDNNFFHESQIWAVRQIPS